MTVAHRYLAGLIGAGLLGALVIAMANPPLREEIGAGVLAGLLVQTPLGWWTLRSIGTERFQLVWLGGMVIRFAIVALAALVLAPLYGWDTGAMLLSLVATLMVLLMVEAITAVREHSRAK
jgi:heme A synthase